MNRDESDPNTPPEREADDPWLFSSKPKAKVAGGGGGPKRFLLSEVSAHEDGLMMERTPYVECYDALAATFQFLDLQNVHSSRHVCRLWNDVARERIEGREGEIIGFIARYNEEIDKKFNEDMAVSQGSKLRLLVASAAAIPGSLLPILVVAVHHGHVFGTNSVDATDVHQTRRSGGSFPFEAGLAWAIISLVIYVGTHVGAGCGFYQSQKVKPLHPLQILALVLYHIANVLGFACWLSLYIWYNTSNTATDRDWWRMSRENFWLFALVAPLIYIFFAPFIYLFGAAAGLLSWMEGGIKIHTAQIRNPFHLLTEAGRREGGGFFEKRRKTVTVAQVEQLMWDWAAAGLDKEEKNQSGTVPTSVNTTTGSTTQLGTDEEMTERVET